MKTLMSLMIAVFLIASQIAIVSADGGYFPEPGYWVRPGEQKAIIMHEENTETMILTSSFQGNAKELVWIIPTPTNPEITKANEEIFENIAKLTMPEYAYGGGIGVMMEATSGVKRLDVMHMQSKKVDYYDVDVVLATNAEDLAYWFNVNDYDYPEEYSHVLQHYINKGWYFTAIKVSPEAQGAMEVIQDFEEGHPTPIKMVFLSEKPVFPLKISSVDFKPEEKEGEIMPYYRYGNYIPIQIWVIAEEKYEATRFNVQYGNWFDKDIIEDLGEDDNGEPLLQPKKSQYYITSLSSSYQKSQMDDDVYFKSADDNKKVNAGPEPYQVFLRGLLIGLFVFLAWLFSFGILFTVGILLLFLSSGKAARIIGWILTGVASVVTLIIGVVLLVSSAAGSSLGNYVVVSILITLFLIVLVMGILMKVQIGRKRK